MTVERVQVEVTPGMVMTDKGLHRPLVYKDNASNVYVEIQQKGDSKAFFVPDMKIRTSEGENFLVGDFDVRVQDEPIGIACMNSSGAQGSNVDNVVSGVSASSSTPNPLVDGISFHSLFFAAWQRHKDGSIKLTAEGRPMPALDVNNTPMVGPLILHWNPRAIRVKNPAAEPVEGEDPDVAPDLVYSNVDPEDPEYVYVGGWGLPNDCGEGMRQGYYDFGYAGINK